MTRARNIAGFSTITTTPSPVHVGPIGVLTATRIDGEFNVVDIASRDITAQGIGVTNLQVSGITTGLNVSGIITAQNGINFNGTSTGFNASGVSTITTLDVNGNGDISGNLTVGGNATIGGVLTYEDVTRIDSVGVITAREQVHVGTGVSIKAGGLNVTAGISTLQAVTGTSFAGGTISGTTGTFSGEMNLGNLLVFTSNNLKIQTSSSSHMLGLQGGATYMGGRIELRGGSSDGDIRMFAQGATATQVERLRIDSSGRVIIGDTSTGNAFSGGDSLVIGNTNSGTRSGITLVSATDQDGGIYFSDGGSSGSANVQGQIVYDHNGTGMKLYTAASERLRIDASGRLLVGGTGNTESDVRLYLHNPSAAGSQMQFTGSGSGTGNSDGFRFGYNGSGAQLWNFESNYVRIATSNVERLRIDASGRMGLGITPTDYHSNNTAVFQLKDGNAIFSRTGGNFFGMFQNIKYNSSDVSQYITNNPGSAYFQAAGEHKWYTAASGTADNNATLNERMRITNDGPHLLLGGTADVHEITESAANAGMVIGGTGFGNAGLAIITSTSGSGRLYFGDATGNASGRNSGGVIYSHSENSLSFRTDDSTAFKAHNNQFEVGTTAGDNGTFAFFRAAGSGAEAGTAGQDGAADKCFHIRGDMGPTHLDQTGTDNFTLKLTNQAYSGSGVSNPQGTVTKILFNGVTYNGWNAYAAIGMDVVNASGGRGDLYFATGGPTARLRILSGGNIYMGDSVNKDGLVNSRGFIFETSGTQQIKTDTTNGKNVMEFGNPNGNVGRITTSGSSTTYYNSSDYRLKENDVKISDGIARVKQLRPIKFNWKSEPDKIVDGFFAHEVSAAVPEAISGVKDEVYTEDNPTKGVSKGDPLYQMIDQSKLVPLLTAALQEAITEIETLKTKVAALEG